MGKKKILIVDDDKDVLSVLEKRLTAEKYSVITANNGQDAIILAKAQRPDLIMLDIIMPGIDGAEVAGKLREYPETKNIPVIFLTCMLTPEEEKQKRHHVAGNIFIAKPYDIKELLSEIKKIV